MEHQTIISLLWPLITICYLGVGSIFSFLWELNIETKCEKEIKREFSPSNFWILRIVFILLWPLVVFIDYVFNGLKSKFWV